MDGYSFVHREHVRFRDLDGMAHVNNPRASSSSTSFKPTEGWLCQLRVSSSGTTMSARRASRSPTAGEGD